MSRLIYKLKRKFMRTCGNSINYSTMKKMLKENPNIIVVDVRTEDEYMNNHLDGAINIPMQDIDTRINKFIKNKKDVIILYCEYGGRSRKVKNKLQKMGYENVYDLDGGIEAI